MSARATGWALTVKGLRPQVKLLLIALADECRRDGSTCFPSRRYLTDIVEVTPRAITKYLGELEEAGLVRREERLRDNGGRSSNIYHLAIDADAVARAALAIEGELPPLERTFQGVEGDPLEQADQGVSNERSTAPGTDSFQGTTLNRDVEPVDEEDESSSSTPPGGSPREELSVEDLGFEWQDWMADFRVVADQPSARDSRAARDRFTERRRDGYEPDELKVATRGARKLSPKAALVALDVLSQYTIDGFILAGQEAERSAPQAVVL